MPYANDELRALRKRSGQKVGPFSKRVETSRSHLLNVEGGRKPGSDELFARCAAALGVRVEDLLQTNSGSGPVDNRPPTKK